MTRDGDEKMKKKSVESRVVSFGNEKEYVVRRVNRQVL